MTRYDLGRNTTLHMHACGEGAIFVNGYLIETGRGVVAIDSTLTESESRGFRKELEALEKPLLAVLVTHPHPDHVAGITNLVVERENDDRRYAAGPRSHALARGAETQAVDARLRSGRGADVDVSEYDHAVGRYRDVRWGHVCGPRPCAGRRRRGEHGLVHRVADADGLPRRPGVQGHALVCRRRLPRRMARQPRRVERLGRGDGHGAPRAPAPLIAQQREYLLALASHVKELAEGHPAFSDAAKKEIENRMMTRYPSAGLTFLIGMSVDPIARELNAGR
jgi:hypothetical protein